MFDIQFLCMGDCGDCEIVNSVGYPDFKFGDPAAKEGPTRVTIHCLDNFDLISGGGLLEVTAGGCFGNDPGITGGSVGISLLNDLQLIQTDQGIRGVYLNVGITRKVGGGFHCDGLLFLIFYFLIN